MKSSAPGLRDARAFGSSAPHHKRHERKTCPRKFPWESTRSSRSRPSPSASSATPATACSSPGPSSRKRERARRQRPRDVPGLPRRDPRPRRLAVRRLGLPGELRSHEIHTPGDAPDVLVAMNPAALKTNLADLKPGGMLHRERRRVHARATSRRPATRRTRSRTPPSSRTTRSSPST